jgi:hypothetical protein
MNVNQMAMAHITCNQRKNSRRKDNTLSRSHR